MQAGWGPAEVGPTGVGPDLGSVEAGLEPSEGLPLQVLNKSFFYLAFVSVPAIGSHLAPGTFHVVM